MLNRTKTKSVPVRQQFKNLSRGRKASSLLFVPFVNSFAARVGQVEEEEMRSDPALLVNAHCQAQKLCRYHGVVLDLACKTELERHRAHRHDGQKLADSLLQSGSLAVGVEAMSRLKGTLGAETALMGMITGPLTMAQSLSQGENNEQLGQEIFAAAQHAVMTILKAIGEIKPDLIFIAEDQVTPEQINGYYSDFTNYLTPFWNTIRYYNSIPVLVTNQITASALTAVSEEVEGVVFTQPKHCPDLEILKSLQRKNNNFFGLPIPEEALAGNSQLHADFVNQLKEAFGNRGFFLVTPGEVSPNIDVEFFQNLVNYM